MAEILPGVHLVEGVDPSPYLTTHLYLLQDRGATWTLLDTGFPGAVAPFLSYLGSHGIEPRSITKILVTHLHHDHVGNLRRLAELTGAKTFAHWVEAAFLAGNPRYDGPGDPPSEFVTVDETVRDGETLDTFGGLVAYHTPGHTPGHVSYYQPERQILFSGDLFTGAGPSASLSSRESTLDLPTAGISARRIARLPIESLLTYHGGPYLHGAGRLVRAAAGPE